MSLARVEAWEAKLREAFDQADAELEKRHGSRFSRKPHRPAHGEGSTRDADGLFDLSVGYTAGFGSAHGEGYVFRVRLATFEPVPGAAREAIEAEALDLLRERLAEAFPGRELSILREGDQYKIIGDLGLD
ncbi:MAG TPA: hypothetical protein PLP29_04030 [Candidatus Ozemobacteraceae bacterium]|nr:hypothetical protein [Candidatus Ozemobacteraceae bacterium]